MPGHEYNIIHNRSLSARRAWIEMCLKPLIALFDFPSLSARRAWIEMGFVDPDADSLTVALRKESVDRNSTGSVSIRAYISRSPQGERG